MTLAGRIQAAAGNRPAVIKAERHQGSIETASKPQRFECSDGNTYAVKFIQNQHGDGRGLFNERVMALCGQLLSAPVATVALIDVPDELAAILDRDKDDHKINFSPAGGVHHGSLWMDDFGPRTDGIQHVETNRFEFGALEILYTWARCNGDHQLLYANDPPNRVLSVDHNAFFTGDAWSPASLATARDVVIDPWFSSAALTADDRAPALQKLAAVGEPDVANVVASPPDEWGVPRDDRVALAEYLLARKDTLLNLTLGGAADA